MSHNIISISNLYKSFGSTEVLHDLSFEVEEGEIFAFLGANGSGKTTTIRCLLGICKASSGELLIDNQPFDYSLTSMLGYLPEERGLYTTSRVLETMVYFGEIKGLNRKEATKRAYEYLERVDLLDKSNTEIKKLSSGQQQKIQLGITIINRPRLLILDEPTKGLDPVNRSLLMNMLTELNKAGSTVVFITHQMEEVEKIADRLVMIKEGRGILYGNVDEVKRQFGINTIHLNYRGDLPENSQLYTFTTQNHFAEITPQKNITSEAIIRFLLEKDIKISKFQIAAPSLQEIFIKVS
ncbi:ATP-binding cassette domain-containing protein [Patescibacteria group bacterium]|nr:ATP-binding cassette domain-containing protein [Patescibacteria group bacterium]